MAGSGSGVPICPVCGQGGRSGALSQAGCGRPSSLWGLEGLRHSPLHRPRGPLNSAPTLGTGGRLGASQVEGSLLAWGERGLRRDVLGRGEELAKLSPLLSCV